jgi:hypothetical protein
MNIHIGRDPNRYFVLGLYLPAASITRFVLKVEESSPFYAEEITVN